MTRNDLRNLPSVQALAGLLVERGAVASADRGIALARAIQDATRRALLADPTLELDAELERHIARVVRPGTRSRYRRGPVVIPRACSN